MKLLLIANSFGVNLQTYAKDIAKENGLELEIYTLYIGGCSLDTHSKNIKENNKDYELFVNGETTNKFVSIKEALELEEWDVISLQQASHFSGNIKMYYPYFEEVYNYVKQLRPKAKIIFHKTWAYSSLNTFKFEQFAGWDDFGYTNTEDMKKGIDKCCDQITKDFKIDAVINSGDVVDLASKKFVDVYDCQGFHMNYIGCYLIGLNLVKILTGKKIEKMFKPTNFSDNLCNKCIEFINNNF